MLNRSNHVTMVSLAMHVFQRGEWLEEAKNEKETGLNSLHLKGASKISLLHYRCGGPPGGRLLLALRASVSSCKNC